MSAPNQIALTRLLIRRDTDVVACRHRSRVIAASLGFDLLDQVRIATAVSDAGRSAFLNSGGATADLSFDSVARPQRLVITVEDSGPVSPPRRQPYGAPAAPGAAEAGLASAYQSDAEIAMHRLMDRVHIDETPAGARVVMEKLLPKGAVILSAAQVQSRLRNLHLGDPPSALDELAAQNAELIRTLAAFKSREEELARINAELADTNRGVVALYDELDTMQRVANVIAAQLDFSALTSAVTEATTDLSAAEFGAFYYAPSDGEPFRLEASAGPLAVDSGPLAEANAEKLLGSELNDEIRVDNLQSSEAGFESPFSKLHFRSYMAVAVRSREKPAGGHSHLRTPSSWGIHGKNAANSQQRRRSALGRPTECQSLSGSPRGQRGEGPVPCNAVT